MIAKDKTKGTRVTDKNWIRKGKKLRWKRGENKKKKTQVQLEKLNLI